MHSQFYKIVKKLISIGHIEISRNYQVAVHPIILTKKRMYIFNTILSKSTISNVTKKQFAYVRNVFLLSGNIVFILWMIFKLKVNTFIYLRKNILNRLRDRKSTRLNSSHVRISYAVF